MCFRFPGALLTHLSDAFNLQVYMAVAERIWQKLQEADAAAAGQPGQPQRHGPPKIVFTDK